MFLQKFTESRYSIYVNAEVVLERSLVPTEAQFFLGVVEPNPPSIQTGVKGGGDDLQSSVGDVMFGYDQIAVILTSVVEARFFGHSVR